nr:PepSY domain-containing protein [uncultured Niameybacter sp.]
MKPFAIGTILLLIGALVGCSNTNAPVNPQPTSEQGTVQNTEQAKMLTEEEATNIVNQEIPGGTIIKLKQDFDDAVPSYEFKVVKDNMEYELEINAYDGTIRGVEKEIEVDQLNAVDPSKLIGDKKAKEIAQNEVPEGNIIGFEYEGDEVIPNYDITIRDTQYEYDFEIDAQTGEILKSEKELLVK